MDYHFYLNKDVLLDFMQREEDYEAAKGTPDAEDNPPLTQP